MILTQLGRSGLTKNCSLSEIFSTFICKLLIKSGNQGKFYIPKTSRLNFTVDKRLSSLYSPVTTEVSERQRYCSSDTGVDGGFQPRYRKQSLM